MKEASELQQLCQTLDKFGLSVAIADFNRRHFVAWNTALLAQTGFSEPEMQILTPQDVILLDAATAFPSRNGDRPEFRACAVRGASEPRVFPGFIAKSRDNLGYVMLQPLEYPDPFALEQRELVAKEQERLHIAKKFHDEIAFPMLAAVFAVAGARDAVESGNRPKLEDLKMASDLLSDILEKMGAALQPPPDDVEPSSFAESGGAKERI
jgi:hypothetical protein